MSSFSSEWTVCVEREVFHRHEKGKFSCGCFGFVFVLLCFVLFVCFFVVTKKLHRKVQQILNVE